jgi:hydroxymethylbilane synthase
MRVRLVSRASALAVLQTRLVAEALRARWPDLDVITTTRSSEGDRNRAADLWQSGEKGLFTADLSGALAAGEADAVVHSWKDLPIEGRPDTTIAATLERADPRDVLLVRREVVDARPVAITILSSSPRRAWQLETSVRRLLPWRVSTLTITPVRGNIPTRIAKLVSGQGDALVVAKAALDRLLGPESQADVVTEIRAGLAHCRWMVLPLKQFPTAPAQGALAIEVAANRPDVYERIHAINHEPTRQAVERERAVLAGFGGGCREAVGATALVREYGEVTSVRAHLPGSTDRTTWTLTTTTAIPPRVNDASIWPRPDERDRASRHGVDAAPPAGDEGLWVARADALPAPWTIDADRLVWTAGGRTWEKLAARGVWVNGCADGLGDLEAPGVDRLAGRTVRWRRLTHTASDDPDALATYAVEAPLPDDLDARTHFFWTSGSLFRRALEDCPSIREGWHASGPGRTSRVIRAALGPDARTSVWLEYEQWHEAVTS